MRVFAFCVVLTLCAACGEATAPQASSSAPVATSAAAQPISPASVTRARTALPADYEVSNLPAGATPIALWGLGENWTSDPVDCARLAQPLAAGGPVAGWSASGPGGIVYVLAGAASGEAPTVDPADCMPWAMSTDHTSAAVTFDAAPGIDAASTVGLVTDTVARVEGGTETHSRAQTFTARLGEYAACVVVVTDPGSTGPALPPNFASDLLVDAVAAMRG